MTIKKPLPAHPGGLLLVTCYLLHHWTWWQVSVGGVEGRGEVVPRWAVASSALARYLLTVKTKMTRTLGQGEICYQNHQTFLNIVTPQDGHISSPGKETQAREMVITELTPSWPDTNSSLVNILSKSSWLRPYNLFSWDETNLKLLEFLLSIRPNSNTERSGSVWADIIKRLFVNFFKFFPNIHLLGKSCVFWSEWAGGNAVLTSRWSSIRSFIKTMSNCQFYERFASKNFHYNLFVDEIETKKPRAPSSK